MANPDFQLFDSKPVNEVSEPEYKRLLGFPPDYKFEGRSRELAEWARQWFAEFGRPWILALPTGFELAANQFRVNGAAFGSRRLHDQLLDAEASRAMLVAVSAGPECEQKARELWQEGKPDEYFFLEVYGSAVVEHLVTLAGARICDWAERQGMAVLPHYSPGYAGWDVAEQTKLFELIRSRTGSELSSRLAVLQSGMLQPKKSLLAVFGYTRRIDKIRALPGLVPCENCSFNPCQYRRRPYRHSLPPLENVADLQPSSNGKAAPPSAPTLTSNAAYTVNARALHKWSLDRLQLRIREDHSIEARFRYDGTTCSNLGQPIRYEYLVKLTPARERYRITEARCGPAPDDTGHEQMCEHLHNPEGLLNAIRTEKPLLGRPLDDVLVWKRRHSPAGCYCDADSRNHKWGLVLEVIHYALVQHEKQTAATNSQPDPVSNNS
jgi:hypothetical protein